MPNYSRVKNVQGQAQTVLGRGEESLTAQSSVLCDPESDLRPLRLYLLVYIHHREGGEGRRR